MRFLVVEDEVVNQLCLQHILEPHAHCDVAGNGEEAVRAFKLAHVQGRPYDLILLDIMMPVMDGQEALVKIRQHERDLGIDPNRMVLVIILTSLSDPKNIVDAYHDGEANVYLVKPIDQNLLLEEIRNIGLKI
jgi:two-component system, chemotaxis family, chemotaxis protein CheY